MKNYSNILLKPIFKNAWVFFKLWNLPLAKATWNSFSCNLSLLFSAIIDSYTIVYFYCLISIIYFTENVKIYPWPGLTQSAHNRESVNGLVAGWERHGESNGMALWFLRKRGNLVLGGSRGTTKTGSGSLAWELLFLFILRKELRMLGQSWCAWRSLP